LSNAPIWTSTLSLDSAPISTLAPTSLPTFKYGIPVAAVTPLPPAV